MAKIKRDIDKYPIISKPRKITGIKPARRLLAQIIYEFQTGCIKTNDAKTLCYLLISYSALWKNELLKDIEDRLTKLEDANGTV